MTHSSPATATALDVVQLARSGRFAEILERLAPQLRRLVTPEALQAAWDIELGRHGAVTAVGEPVEEPPKAGAVVVKVPLACERGGLTVVAAVTAAGFLAGVQLAPPEAAAPVAPWESPAYADSSSFVEREVVLGAGPLAVPGTLSLPRAPGRFPGVVLLAGSGPSDRDETIGRNKPLKDLAWGLATRGVAALRFDKVTFAHPAEVQAFDAFTLSDEYLPAALAAVEELRREPAVDPARIFLAGHSLGGTVAPRAAAADRSVAGLAILAGGATPMYRSMVRQFRYLASLDPASAATAGPAADVLERQADLIDSDELSAATPPDELPLGVPAPYWLDLRSYDPVALAASLDRPILLVQGGRDYQATVDDDLARWRAGLAGRPDVTVHVHPVDDHLFFPGSGPSSPAEYEAAQHVDPQVVRDLAEWVSATGTGTAHGGES